MTWFDPVTLYSTHNIMEVPNCSKTLLPLSPTSHAAHELLTRPGKAILPTVPGSRFMKTFWRALMRMDSVPGQPSDFTTHYLTCVQSKVGKVHLCKRLAHTASLFYFSRRGDLHWNGRKPCGRSMRSSHYGFTLVTHTESQLRRLCESAHHGRQRPWPFVTWGGTGAGNHVTRLGWRLGYDNNFSENSSRAKTCHSETCPPTLPKVGAQRVFSASGRLRWNGRKPCGRSMRSSHYGFTLAASHRVPHRCFMSFFAPNSVMKLAIEPRFGCKRCQSGVRPRRRQCPCSSSKRTVGWKEPIHTMV